MVVATAEFGARLTGLVLARFPTRDAFAEAVGMKPTYVSRILKGHVGEPTRATLVRFAEALEMSVPELRRLTGLPLDDEAAGDEPDVILALMMAHPQAGPMVIRLKAEASVEDYPGLLEESLEHFAVGLGRQLRKRREEQGGE